ncbi:mucin-1-like [Schistocerca gregaria]|uniref:mucin-1-like n=1 Tax=Schistocerca gregaria TaxID=7010 RepID=UPI00211E822D|nr:mucin-1-like [Schistocerca gregaria]
MVDEPVVPLANVLHTRNIQQLLNITSEEQVLVNKINEFLRENEKAAWPAEDVVSRLRCSNNDYQAVALEILVAPAQEQPEEWTQVGKKKAESRVEAQPDVKKRQGVKEARVESRQGGRRKKEGRVGAPARAKLGKGGQQQGYRYRVEASPGASGQAKLWNHVVSGEAPGVERQEESESGRVERRQDRREVAVGGRGGDQESSRNRSPRRSSVQRARGQPARRCGYVVRQGAAAPARGRGGVRFEPADAEKRYKSKREEYHRVGVLEAEDRSERLQPPGSGEVGGTEEGEPRRVAEKESEVAKSEESFLFSVAVSVAESEADSVAAESAGADAKSSASPEGACQQPARAKVIMPSDFAPAADVLPLSDFSPRKGFISKTVMTRRDATGNGEQQQGASSPSVQPSPSFHGTPSSSKKHAPNAGASPDNGQRYSGSVPVRNGGSGNNRNHSQLAPVPFNDVLATSAASSTLAPSSSGGASSSLNSSLLFNNKNYRHFHASSAASGSPHTLHPASYNLPASNAGLESNLTSALSHSASSHPSAAQSSSANADGNGGNQHRYGGTTSPMISPYSYPPLPLVIPHFISPFVYDTMDHTRGMIPQYWSEPSMMVWSLPGPQRGPQAPQHPPPQPALQQPIPQSSAPQPPLPQSSTSQQAGASQQALQPPQSGSQPPLQQPGLQPSQAALPQQPPLRNVPGHQNPSGKGSPLFSGNMDAPPSGPDPHFHLSPHPSRKTPEPRPPPAARPRPPPPTRPPPPPGPPPPHSTPSTTPPTLTSNLHTPTTTPPPPTTTSPSPPTPPGVIVPRTYPTQPFPPSNLSSLPPNQSHSFSNAPGFAYTPPYPYKAALYHQYDEDWNTHNPPSSSAPHNPADCRPQHPSTFAPSEHTSFMSSHNSFYHPAPPHLHLPSNNAPALKVETLPDLSKLGYQPEHSSFML